MIGAWIVVIGNLDCSNYVIEIQSPLFDLQDFILLDSSSKQILVCCSFWHKIYWTTATFGRKISGCSLQFFTKQNMVLSFFFYGSLTKCFSFIKLINSFRVINVHGLPTSKFWEIKSLLQLWIIQWILRLTLVNSWHEKYDFDICKGFSMGKKMTEILPDFEDF